MNLLKYLEKQAKLSGSPCVSYDELVEWPVEQIEEAKQQGCLIQTDDAEGIICCQCPKLCWKEVEIRPKDGHSVGVYFCEDEDCAGLIEIKIERLQQWQIDKKKLWKLVYGFESEWQVPWDENNTEYFSLKEAVNLANDDSITVRSMSRLLEDLEFPIRRMHKGRRCKVHIADFRKWFQYAQHGTITDKAIENYNKGIQIPKENARQKKKAKKVQKSNRDV